MQGIIVLGEQPSVWENRAAFSTWIVDRVFQDACHWSRTARRVTTANELVDSSRISQAARRALHRASP